MENEIWKDILGYECLYQISNKGRVKRLSAPDSRGYFRKEHYLKPQIDGSGYLQVRLSKNGVGTLILVHRLVAEAFIPNPYSKSTVNHLDENKKNNSSKNLEWATRKEQMNYGSVMDSHKKPVIQFDLKGNKIKCWESAAEAQKKLGINHAGISKCCLRQFRTCRGYIWRYA